MIASLSGHKDQVTCLRLSSQQTRILASGSDDTSIRVWDVEVRKCTTGIIGLPDPITSLAWASPHVLFASSGRHVYGFDIRAMAPVMNSNAAIFKSTESADEINSIDIHQKETHWLARGDDTGAVDVIDIRANKTMKKMRTYHANICNFVTFRPKRRWELWSGGMDYRILQHNVSNGAATATFDLEDIPVDESETEATSNRQKINPLFVYAGAFSDDGNTFVSGIGDGSLCFISQLNRKLEATKLEAHVWSTTAIDFTKSTNASQPQSVVSGGLDGSIFWWEKGVDGKWWKRGAHATKYKVNCLQAQQKAADDSSLLVFVGGCPKDDNTESKKVGDIHIWDFSES
ncbi:WD repeat-containing protein 53 [Chytridiales sp. JEL 0842]|nr:WD repeat-containing protein 53 [Chytridiales sp. JEL 0842]